MSGEDTDRLNYLLKGKISFTKVDEHSFNLVLNVGMLHCPYEEGLTDAEKVRKFLDYTLLVHGTKNQWEPK